MARACPVLGGSAPRGGVRCEQQHAPSLASRRAAARAPTGRGACVSSRPHRPSSTTAAASRKARAQQQDRIASSRPRGAASAAAAAPPLRAPPADAARCPRLTGPPGHHPSPRPPQIADSFKGKYYDVLINNPRLFARFFKDDSQLTVALPGAEPQTAAGPEVRAPRGPRPAAGARPARPSAAGAACAAAPAAARDALARASPPPPPARPLGTHPLPTPVPRSLPSTPQHKHPRRIRNANTPP